jgi:hypothetical protein
MSGASTYGVETVTFVNALNTPKTRSKFSRDLTASSLVSKPYTGRQLKEKDISRTFKCFTFP